MKVFKSIPLIFLTLILLLTACSDNGDTTCTTTSKQDTEPLTPIIHDDGIFTIAIIPDTQQEVVVDQAIKNKHFRNRTEWLVANAHVDLLDLRCVVHTGDMVNWGNEEPKQFEIASDAMDVLVDADIPTIYSIGNHDTAAVTVGGSAADPKNTRDRQRDTQKFNKYFPIDKYNYLIPFEHGKIDNTYYKFVAENAKWLILSLELWPRSEVIDWAEEVIADNPDHNVIITTHSYLTSSAGIYQKSDYGHNSPQVIYDRIVSQYANVKFVFSGHVGTSAHRIDTGVHGNKIISILGCFHSNFSNPVQLLEIDTLLGTASIRTYSPIDNVEWTQYEITFEDVGFILFN